MLRLKPETSDIKQYLAPSEIIDFEDDEVHETAFRLTKGLGGDIAMAKRAYEFVRDDIRHSFDIRCDEVTYRASDVLKHGHGICYAKAHLLAAILRCLMIPAGLCYQRLKDDSRFVLHGLNAFYLESLGRWVRVDARGNKEGVVADFSTDEEVLAYTPVKELGEEDYHIVYARPSPGVIVALKKSSNTRELVDNLPERP